MFFLGIFLFLCNIVLHVHAYPHTHTPTHTLCCIRIPSVFSSLNEVNRAPGFRVHVCAAGQSSLPVRALVIGTSCCYDSRHPPLRGWWGERGG